MTCLLRVAFRIVGRVCAGLQVGLLALPLRGGAADVPPPALAVPGRVPAPVVFVPSPLAMPPVPPSAPPSPAELLLAACLPGYAREVDGRCLRHDLPRVTCGPAGDCLVTPPDLLPYGHGPALRRGY